MTEKDQNLEIESVPNLEIESVQNLGNVDAGLDLETRSEARDLEQNLEKGKNDLGLVNEKRNRLCPKSRRRHPLRRTENPRLRTEHRKRRRNPLLRMRLWLRRGHPDLEVGAEKGLDLVKKRKGRDQGQGKNADPGKAWH